jgi:hypothetical protein
MPTFQHPIVSHSSLKDWTVDSFHILIVELLHHDPILIVTSISLHSFSLSSRSLYSYHNLLLLFLLFLSYYSPKIQRFLIYYDYFKHCIYLSYYCLLSTCFLISKYQITLYCYLYLLIIPISYWNYHLLS